MGRRWINRKGNDIKKIKIRKKMTLKYSCNMYSEKEKEKQIYNEFTITHHHGYVASHTFVETRMRIPYNESVWL